MYKIILADDEATMRRALLTLIDWEAMDCEVVYAAEDGQAVLDYLSICKPDIIISDIRMPRIDGLQLAEYLSKREPQIKMILLTAFAEFQYAQQAIRWNVSEYVVKTGALDSIVAAVERCKEQLEKAGKAHEDRARELAHFFKAIAEGTLYQEKEILLRSASLGVEAQPRILLLQCLPAAEFPEEHLRLEMLNRAARLLTDMLGAGVETMFPMEAGLSCFIIAGMEQEELERRCRQAQASFARLTGAPFHLGITTCGRDLLRLPEGVRQCREALDYCFYFPQCTISTYSSSRFSSDGAAFFSAQNVRLADTLRLGATGPSRELLEGIFAFQKKNLLRPDEVRQEGLQILGLCKSGVAAARERWSSVQVSGVDDRTAIMNCDSFQDYRSLLTEIVANTCRVISGSIDSRSDIVLQAQQYIEDNFRRDLSLGEIAAAVNVNPSYLSRAFKGRTGVSIVDTITRMRMEEAKLLLSGGTLRVGEIAKRVGMENTTYFSHVFRKYTGLAPREYQDLKQKQDAER